VKSKYEGWLSWHCDSSNQQVERKHFFRKKMTTLSEYELQRQRNIDSNETVLRALGLIDAKKRMRDAAPAMKPKKPKPSPSNNKEPRRSSRVEGKVVDYSAYDVDLDALDKELKRKKKARHSVPPDRYEDGNYDKPRVRKNNKRDMDTDLLSDDIRQQHTDMLSKLPVQPASLPSLSQLNSLRNYCMTKEHLENANYPPESIEAYEALLVERPFTTEQPCMFELQSYTRMLVENRLMDCKPKVVCPICMTDKSLIATLPARIQGGKIHGHMCGC
tara:strand:- start:3772 stop:4593 length:822 start_codon:yes stop_codon:yes gene_type:complete